MSFIPYDEVNETDKSLDKEVELTSRCLGRLGALLCDVIEIRDTLEYENDINYFDKTVDPAREEVLIEVSRLNGYLLLFLLKHYLHLTYLVLCPKAN